MESSDSEDCFSDDPPSLILKKYPIHSKNLRKNTDLNSIIPKLSFDPSDPNFIRTFYKFVQSFKNATPEIIQVIYNFPLLKNLVDIFFESNSPILLIPSIQLITSFVQAIPFHELNLYPILPFLAERIIQLFECGDSDIITLLLKLSGQINTCETKYLQQLENSTNDQDLYILNNIPCHFNEILLNNLCLFNLRDFLLLEVLKKIKPPMNRKSFQALYHWFFRTLVMTKFDIKHLQQFRTFIDVCLKMKYHGIETKKTALQMLIKLEEFNYHFDFSEQEIFYISQQYLFTSNNLMNLTIKFLKFPLQKKLITRVFTKEILEQLCAALVVENGNFGGPLFNILTELVHQQKQNQNIFESDSQYQEQYDLLKSDVILSIACMCLCNHSYREKIEAIKFIEEVLDTDNIELPMFFLKSGLLPVLAQNFVIDSDLFSPISNILVKIGKMAQLHNINLLNFAGYDDILNVTMEIDSQKDLNMETIAHLRSVQLYFLNVK